MTAAREKTITSKKETNIRSDALRHKCVENPMDFSTHIRPQHPSEFPSRQTCKRISKYRHLLYLPSIPRARKSPTKIQNHFITRSPRFIRRRGPQRPGTLHPTSQVKWRGSGGVPTLRLARAKADATLTRVSRETISDPSRL